MRKRLIALMLMAAFVLEQTNVLTAFAAENNEYLPIYNEYGDEVSVQDVLEQRELGNNIAIYDPDGNTLNIDDIVTENSESSSANSSSSDTSASTDSTVYDNANSSGEYNPVYDEQGNEVNPVDVLAEAAMGNMIPIYDGAKNEINPHDLVGKLYDLYGSTFKYIPVYDENGNEIDWCGLLDNIDEWNARGFYTVTFIDSFDNSTIETYVVPKEESITELPTPPAHENYTFLDWIGNYNGIQKNEIVTAVYLESTAKLDVFGYIDNTDEFFEFYIYGTRRNTDGVLSTDLSQVQLALNEYTWIDEMGNTFVPNEDGNFVDQRGNIFIPSKESEVPKTTTGIPVVMLAGVGNTETAIGATNKNSTNTISSYKDFNTAKVTKDATKTTIRYALNVLIAKNPYLNFAAGPLVGLIEAAFDENAVTTNQLSEQIKDVDKHINKVQEELKNHNQNIADFTALASEFDELQKKSETLKTTIENLEIRLENGSISEDTYKKNVAALYNRSVYTDVYSAFYGATNAFKGKTSYTQRTIFDVAYEKQLGYVMFSGEALDCLAPYVLTQLEIYSEAYGNMNLVLNAYEDTKGGDAAVASRNKLYEYMAGDDTSPSVYQICADFYSNNDRYIFVDKSADSKNHIALKSNLTVNTSIASKYCKSGWLGGSINFPGELTGYTLSADQVNRLSEHCKGKKISILDYLENHVGFALEGIPEPLPFNYIFPVWMNPVRMMNPLDADASREELTRQIKAEEQYKEAFVTSFKKNCYLLTGPQEGYKENTKDGCIHRVNAVNASTVGAGSEVVDLFSRKNERPINDINVLIFQRK